MARYGIATNSSTTHSISTAFRPESRRVLAPDGVLIASFGASPSRARGKRTGPLAGLLPRPKTGSASQRIDPKTPRSMAAHAASPAGITILCVEDHPVFREGLRTIIASQHDMQLVAHATTAADAVDAFVQFRPDVTLLDVRLPGPDGIEALKGIRQQSPQARVLILSTSDRDVDISRALRAGASGYLLKSAPRMDLLAAIRTVHAGGRHVAPDVAVRFAESVSVERLTPRELEVLELIREGRRNKQIARRLSISETTVNFHIRNLGQKLGANDRAHAVAIGIRLGLLEP